MDPSDRPEAPDTFSICNTLGAPIYGRMLQRPPLRPTMGANPASVGVELVILRDDLLPEVLPPSPRTPPSASVSGVACHRDLWAMFARMVL